MKLHLLCVSLLVLKICANCWCQSGSNETVDYDVDDMFTTQPPPSETTIATCVPVGSGSGSGSGLTPECPTNPTPTEQNTTTDPGPITTTDHPTGMYVINNRTKFMWNVCIIALIRSFELVEHS